MAAYRKAGAFNEAAESWSSYIERLGHYFVANDVQDSNKKQAILLTSRGVNRYGVI